MDCDSVCVLQVNLFHPNFLLIMAFHHSHSNLSKTEPKNIQNSKNVLSGSLVPSFLLSPKWAPLPTGFVNGYMLETEEVPEVALGMLSSHNPFFLSPATNHNQS